MNNTRQGFTLIELLMIITLTSILAAVLIPNLLGAQNRSKDTAALSCARDLAGMAASYSADNNTYLGFNGTGDYAPGQACDARQIKTWSIISADQSSISGTVTSLSKKGTIIKWDGANFIK